MKCSLERMGNSKEISRIASLQLDHTPDLTSRIAVGSVQASWAGLWKQDLCLFCILVELQHGKFAEHRFLIQREVESNHRPLEHGSVPPFTH